MQNHVIYVGFTDIQYVACIRGHELSYFIRKGFIRAIPTFMSVTVIIFWNILIGYQAEREKEQGTEGTNFIVKKFKKELIQMINDDNLE